MVQPVAQPRSGHPEPPHGRSKPWFEANSAPLLHAPGGTRVFRAPCPCLSRAVTNKAKCAIARVISLPQICWAGWVGDQDSTYYGLQAALLNMFASAYHNYVNVGSDLGGFRYVEYQNVAVCNLS